jgi:Concanavalin A-like lectin/glucanases superfamily
MNRAVRFRSLVAGSIAMVGAAIGCSLRLAGTASLGLEEGGLPDAGVLEAAAFCGDPALIACYRFEGSVTDLGPNRLDPDEVTNVGFADAGALGQAIVFGDGSVVRFPPNEAWNTASVTIEAWVHPSSLPPDGGRAGVFDSESRYALFLYGPLGTPRCRFGADVQGAPIEVGAWTHLACVYDATTGVVTEFQNGVPIAASDAGVLPATSALGTALGGNFPALEPFDGLIDEVRVFHMARTPQQIAIAAAARP